MCNLRYRLPAGACSIWLMKENLSLSQIVEKIAVCNRKMEILDSRMTELEDEITLLKAEPNYSVAKKK